MAINPSTNATMAGRITAADGNYPYGSSKDETAPGAGDGTPYFKARADDIFGFQQALLNAASIVPSGNADNVNASQYLQALVEIASGRATAYDDVGAVNAYVLNARANQAAPASYFDGMEVVFTAGASNTGASTVNVAGLGVVPLETEDGAAIPSGAINQILLTRLRYSATAAAFFLVDATNRALKGAPASDTSIVGYAFELDGDTGLFAEGGDDINNSDIVLRSDGQDIGRFTKTDVSATSSGYVKLPSGLILQWGQFTQADNGGVVGFSFNLPLTYPNAGLQAFLTVGSGIGAGQDFVSSAEGVVSTTQVTGFTVGPVANRVYRVFSIGY